VPSSTPKLLLIGSDNPTTWIVYNRLIREFGLFDAIIENRVSRTALIKVRARKLGWRTVLGQLAFVTLIRPVISYQAAHRIRTICKRNDLEMRAPHSPVITRLININSTEAVSLISAKAPDIVIVNGTRILKKAVLKSTLGVFLNTHQGITPQYRGGHGAYWALFQNDPQHCGVTVHLVDEGIDTGNIVAQAPISPETSDNFVTYPFLQSAAALPLLVTAIQDIAKGTLATRAIQGATAVWYHPGAWQYIKGRWRGVR
jgi:folate-dependent phosphoribosylglycinamide formyltransferase PurN